MKQYVGLDISMEETSIYLWKKPAFTFWTRPAA